MIERARLVHPYSRKDYFYFVAENNHKKGYVIEKDKNGDAVALEKEPPTAEELKAIDAKNIAHLNMTRLDFVNCLEKLGVSWAAIKALMAANPEVEKQLEMCSNVWRGNALLDAMLPLVNNTLNLNITPVDLDEAFIQVCGYERIYQGGEE